MAREEAKEMLLIIQAFAEGKPLQVRTENNRPYVKNMNDECSDCPFNDTSCPGGMWCISSKCI